MNEGGEARHPGARHWWWQRLSALALIPLTLWFVFAILAHIGDDYGAALAWLSRPLTAAAAGVYLVFMFIHSHLGLQVIIEDYVSEPAARRKALLGMAIINALIGVIAVVSVARVAFSA